MIRGQMAERPERTGAQFGGQFVDAFPADLATRDQGQEQVRDHAAGQRVELRRLLAVARPGTPLSRPVEFLRDAQQDGAPRASGVLERR